ncbi:hypothetical protein KDQ92_004252 [Salmonella enterica subsp. enterica serovar Newport]|nr:hypothetical protein [Salmonella enterica subsp. enterica serovar Newport]
MTVNSEERLMARARTWFADGQHTLNDLLLYLSLHGERENIVFWRDAHDDVFGMMTVTFFRISHGLEAGPPAGALFLRGDSLPAGPGYGAEKWTGREAIRRGVMRGLPESGTGK